MNEPIKELQDTDPMPWGTYRNKPMQDVPAQYLHWLWTNGSKLKVAVCPVAAYINKNISALKKEYKDGIWS